MPETPRLTLSGIVLDSPDPRALAAFYSRLLGWTVEQNEPDWVKLRAPDGGAGLSFQAEAAYKKPTWPAGPGDQQMMIHLDIRVDDLDTAGAHAVSAGATLATFQPQAGVRVYLDPVGHPFCLFVNQFPVQNPGSGPGFDVEGWISGDAGGNWIGGVTGPSLWPLTG